MHLPPVSIVVATYNRRSQLERCIAALLELDYPDYEILIVNDASPDDTAAFLDGLDEERLHPIHQPKNRGVAAARNAGIAAARHNILAFTDDDCRPDPQWLKNLVQGFTDEGVGAVIGRTVYVDEEYKAHFPERIVSNEQAHWPMTCNIAYRKAVFKECGGFDPTFVAYHNEDTELAIRVASKGFSFTRAPKALVRHQQDHWTLKGLLRSAKNVSLWVPLMRLYPNHYKTFKAPVWNGFIHPEDWLLILASPVLVPVLLLRYLYHGKTRLDLFFAKWPLYFLLRRFYILKERYQRS